MKTFMEIAKDNREHKLNYAAMTAETMKSDNHIIGIDNGIYKGISTFSIDIWKDNEVIDNFIMTVENGAVINTTNQRG